MSNVSAFPDLVTTDADRSRKQRRPMHPFRLKQRPFVIHPFFIAPVLPGETMRHFSMQSRVVSDPIVDKMAGAHNEYYFFYVKHRDLTGRDDFEEMFIDPDKDLSAYIDSADDAQYYYLPGTSSGINWLKLCLTRIVDEHFRGDDESWDDFVDSVTGLPVAQVNNVPGWLASASASDDFSALDVAVSTAGDNEFTVSELQFAMNQHQMLLMNGMTQQSFEDYIRDSGVFVGKDVEPHIPELLWMSRQWSYPTNAVEPTDGSVASAYVWSETMRRSNAKFFKEPGFLVGVSIVRPKVYFANLDFTPLYGMITQNDWLPPMLRNNARAGSRQWSAGAGPAQSGFDTEGYRIWLDDLFLYGDQFANFDISGETDVSKVALPIDGTDLVNVRYPSAADINALFVDSADMSGLRYIRQDGIINLSIDSYLRDSMPGTPASV